MTQFIPPVPEVVMYCDQGQSTLFLCAHNIIFKLKYSDTSKDLVFHCAANLRIPSGRPSIDWLFSLSLHFLVVVEMFLTSDQS